MIREHYCALSVLLAMFLPVHNAQNQWIVIVIKIVQIAQPIIICHPRKHALLVQPVLHAEYANYLIQPNVIYVQRDTS